MKNVAIYVRSSKDLHNVSCAAQEEQIRKFVKDEERSLQRRGLFTESQGFQAICTKEYFTYALRFHRIIIL